jgi:hypothetical protein
MNKLQRELVSRATAGVVGLAFLYGGWRCVAKGMEFSEEARGRQVLAKSSSTRRSSGSGLPFMAGGVLLLIGAAIGGIAVVPTRLIDKVYRISPPETGDRGQDANRNLGPFRWM